MKTKLLTFVSGVLVAGSALALSPRDASTQRLIGTWQCTATPEQGMSVSVTDTYHADGTVTSKGQFVIEEGADSMRLRITSQATWSVVGDHVDFVTNSMSVTSDTDPEFAKLFEKMVQAQDPKTRVNIVSLNKGTLVLREVTQNMVTTCSR